MLDAPERVDQADALHRGRSALSDAHRVALGDQVLDDVGAGGRRPDALLVQHRREVLVLDLLAGVLHQREQARLGDARRRLGLLGLDSASRRRRPRPRSLGLDRATSGGSSALPFSSLTGGSTARQPSSLSERARERKLSPSTSVTRSTRSHSAGGWKAPRKRRITRSNRRLSSPVSGSPGRVPVGMIAKWSETPCRRRCASRSRGPPRWRCLANCARIPESVAVRRAGERRRAPRPPRSRGSRRAGSASRCAGR